MIETMYETGALILSGVNPPEPEKVHFTNSELAYEIFSKAVFSIKGGSGCKIVIHADVDFDGAAAAYIANNVCEYVAGRNNSVVSINTKREHGITDNFVNNVINRFNADQKRINLVIIVDSSTNLQPLLKSMNCDVIVLDHHELEVPVEEMTGETAGGRYVIINNEIDHIPDMSGAQVVYEWFRYVGFDAYVKMKKLYSWVAVSLFSDVINGDNARNQWYIHNTIDRGDYEETLSQMFKGIYKSMTGNKTDISFSLVPLINAAVRTGHSVEMMNIIMSEPQNILKLRDYKERQNMLVTAAISSESKALRMREYPDLILYDITGIDDLVGFEGLIATKLLNDYRKTTIAYSYREFGAKGSFRVTGRYSTCALREKLNSLGGFKASGHSDAFGFEAYGNSGEEAIASLVQTVVSIADSTGSQSSNGAMTFHREVDEIVKEDDLIYVDVYTEEGMRRLISSMELSAMATINSRMSGGKKALIRVPNNRDTVKITNASDREIWLRVLGLDVITFNSIRENYGYIWLYPEINKYLTVYVDSVRL